jgi:hypothetical protein
LRATARYVDGAGHSKRALRRDRREGDLEGLQRKRRDRAVYARIFQPKGVAILWLDPVGAFSGSDIAFEVGEAVGVVSEKEDSVL